MFLPSVIKTLKIYRLFNITAALTSGGISSILHMQKRELMNFHRHTGW